ncbi:MAG: carbohydrate ABC transporter permease [SAR324 cluster bacterium]|nr:carbohydrate ABC transporter permease [SAR324 cluster bacterium]MCZ6749026.1 carbohydrate ABC transporter permease [SAR324 cluster bacterium]
MGAAYLGETYWRRLIVFYIPMFMFLAAMLFPFYWMTVTSVKADAELYNAKAIPFLVFDFTLDHWIYLFRETLYIRWALNTLFIATVSTAISLFAGTLAGYSLARLRFPGSSTFGISIFVTYLVPPTLLFIPLAGVVSDLRLYDSPWALILTYPTFLVPFSTWLLMGYFRTIPREMEECARIDGATRLQAFVKVVLPLGLPGLISAGIFSFTLSWNEFLYALVFISSPEQKTIPVGVVSELIKGDVFFWGSLMAGALFGSVPVAIVYSFFVEHYVSGITGAVKG